MLRSKVVRIDRAMYLAVPKAEARRLGIQEGDDLEVAVRRIAAGTTADALALRGRFKGAFTNATLSDVWGF